MKLGLELSEKFDTPVMLRLTTRICHGKGIVNLEDREERALIPYEHKIKKYVATPGISRALRVQLERRIKDMTEYSNTTEINREENSGHDIGVISSGVAYQYARETFGDNATYLKLGMTYPMPMEKIKAFAAKVKKLYVIEEMDPYIEDHLLKAGIQCTGKEKIPRYGELNPDIVRESLLGIKAETLDIDSKVSPRPPVMCPGCSHRGVFYVLSKKLNKIMVTGDIGCYGLGSAPPHLAVHSIFCMGVSIITGHGAGTVLRKAGSPLRAVDVIGDYTFYHTGVNSLMDVVYNRGNAITIILDNRITAMTGHQENPGSGFTLMGEPAVEADVKAMCLAIGMKQDRVVTVNPLDLAETEEAVDAALSRDEPTVIIAKWPCVLKKLSEQDRKEFDLRQRKCLIEKEKCTNCKMCMKSGCPALKGGDSVQIIKDICTGCGVCRQICKFSAIKEI
jgi:indolepyruvate ferredoxin oxidoreductase alpha subunit